MININWISSKGMCEVGVSGVCTVSVCNIWLVVLPSLHILTLQQPHADIVKNILTVLFF